MATLTTAASEILLDPHFKNAIVNALAFYSEFHTSSIEDVEFKFWRECFDADSVDLSESHALSVDKTASKIANCFS